MRDFFPRHTSQWAAQEVHSLARLARSTVEMGLITGVVFRVYHALVLSDVNAGLLTLGVTFTLGAIFIFGMVTLNLGMFPVHRWLWRAPAFAASEFVAEALMSAALIAIHREPLGSTRAVFGDWLGMIANVFFWRLIPILVFALLLAAVVQFTRLVLLKREHREHTVQAVHEHRGDEKQTVDGGR